MSTALGDEIVAVADALQDVDVSVARRWVCERSLEDIAVIAWFVTEHHVLLDRHSMSVIAPQLIEDLSTIVKCGNSDLSQYDALSYLGRIFQILWVRGNSRDLLYLIKGKLEEMIAGWPQSGLDLALLVVLEHLFTDPEKRNFFESWINNTSFNQAFLECERLARSSDTKLNPYSRS